MFFLGISGSDSTAALSGTRLSSIASLFGLIVLCILIIVASYFVTRLVGGKQLACQKNSNFKTVDTFHLAQNKYLSIIQVGRRYFVIAICKDTVTMLSELQEEDITMWRAGVQDTASFKSIFTGMLKKQPITQEGEEPVKKTSPSPDSEYDDDIK